MELSESGANHHPAIMIAVNHPEINCGAPV
jgi:hypothetical protein